jgi:hypothetical protein
MLGGVDRMIDRWRHQELVFQRIEQSLDYDPSEGRPAGTPTVEVMKVASETIEPATLGPCEVDRVSTTLAEPASPGQTTLALVSGSGVLRGRRYLLSGETQEWIEVRAVDGARVATRRPLLFSYPAAATLIGCRISVAVDPTWAADRSKLTDTTTLDPDIVGYRVSWAYEVGGTQVTGTSSADLVRHAALDLVRPMDVDDRFPGWIDGLPAPHRENQGIDLILEAFTAVKLDALGNRHAMYCVRDASILCELVKYRANLIAVEHNALFGRASTLDLSIAERRYQARRDELLCEPAGARPERPRRRKTRGSRG